MTTWIGIALAVLVGLALLLKWRRPVWYWLSFGVTLAILRVLFRYAAVMEACRLTVPASRMRRALARWMKKPIPQQRVPRLLWIRPTRTGVRLRIRLWPGQDAFEFAAASDRLRHSFAVHQVTSREIKPGVIEIALTGYDVLKRVQMPAITDRGLLKIPLALVEDGAVHYRDYREVPHAITVGATQSGKSVTQRTVIKELASQPVALVGIDCKKIELGPFARRFSALADNPDDAMELLEALVARMEITYDTIRREQRISADTPDAEIAANIWDLPEDLRPVPIVVTIDEIAELALSTRKNDPRRDRIVKALVRLAQLGRAAGIFLDIYGQRFGSELGDGITMLRAQLTGRMVHRVNDESTAKMAFGDISPHAVFAATQIPNSRRGMAVVGYSTGEWVRIRTPHTTMRQAVAACNKHAHLAPDLPELARFRPLMDLAPVEAPAVAEAV
ncbi:MULTISPECIES: FtsK/SpoIIIE domain-containing protein [unclassified Streptomyces]|uniref:FtsK/SpoIIIE domain-containing protein n=1 Tax=unclassified Streptomyces TaxID=2593676 RepID=UPI002475ECB8|nr:MULTISPECIES: FtsK/SpoIIIE domain-containing protein [unclassified Streptomyces]MDH6452886.1 S-DNA-T family DNA segregation ATPase FtsK/SpoIIIE [Streptomyces sp. SAI-119]MDH6496554.1 S-DNA-T family DNA segregation ATPase FtsK/SpoIIIE [Streptomyces sp. SAI-149]